MSTEPATGGAATPSTTTATPAAATPAIGTPAPAAASTDWTSGLSDDHRGYVQTKGFKDANAVLDSYRGLEKTMGAPAEHILRLPKDLSGPEGKAVWERLGAPKEPKEYKIEIAKEFQNEKLADAVRELAFQNNMTHKQAEGVVKFLNDQQINSIKSHQEAVQTKATADLDGLKKEWGSAFDQNKNIADQAALKFGIDEARVAKLGAALGPGETMKLLYSLGKGIGEAAYVSGQSAGGSAMTPAHARAEIENLKADASFVTRFKSGERDAVNQWNKLNEAAFAQAAR